MCVKNSIRFELNCISLRKCVAKLMQCTEFQTVESFDSGTHNVCCADVVMVAQLQFAFVHVDSSAQQDYNVPCSRSCSWCCCQDYHCTS